MSKKESRYVKLTHREHILKRPDSYIGSVESEEVDMYVIDDCDLDDVRVVKKKVNNNPGFIKIFDEILSNASDHSIRTGEVSMIKINIEDNKIIIENDGPTVDLAIHPTEKVYIPELIFSNLLTGENFKDNEERNVAGKNGYGSKITNCYSKKFKVECCNGKQLYRQWSRDSMKIIDKPDISKVKKGTKAFTRITYYPDYSLFGLDGLTPDLKSLMYKRCLDVAAYLPKVRISVDGKTLNIKKLKDFMNLHIDEGEDVFYEDLPNGWKVGVSKSPNHGFEQVSVVNGTSVLSGTHTNFISLNLSKEVVKKLPKKVNANWTDVKNKLFLFLVCEINQPKFESQSKTNLTSKMNASEIGDTTFSDNFIKKISKSEIVKSILEEIELREKLSLKKLSGGKKKTIKMDKLVDANKAGTKDSDKCSLFLCEGDCFHYDTPIMVIRDGIKESVRAEDLEIGDGVITHKSNISTITNKTKKINKGFKISIGGDDMIFGGEHRLFIYDKSKDIFEFIEVDNINKNLHQLVKNRNAFFDNLVSIISIEDIDDDKYNKLIKVEGEDIMSTNGHKFCCYNIEGQFFKMLNCEDIDITEWHLVNYQKI